MAYLIRNRLSHVDWEGRVVAFLNVLLEVATSHVLHHDELVILARELLLEAHNVRTVSTTVLELNLSDDLLRLFLASKLRLDTLERESFVC